MKRLFAVVVFCLLSVPALAVEPDEVLSDPALEARARALSQGLRCLVCRNESIDDSNAGLAKDLRLLVRERLEAGDSDEAVIDYVVSRYGEYVLLKPQNSGSNLLLWWAGPLMLVIAAIGAFFYLRGRNNVAPQKNLPLSEKEEERLREILKD